MPLILAFAGYRMPPGQLEQLSGLDGSGAIVVYPQAASTAAGVGWQGAPYSSGADDVAFTTALLDDVESRLHRPETRVRRRDLERRRVRVVAVVRPPRTHRRFRRRLRGDLPRDQSAVREWLPVPVIEFHGTADDVIPYDGGIRHDATVAPVSLWLSQVATRNGCAADPRSESGCDGSREADVDRMPRPRCPGALPDRRGRARVAGSGGLGRDGDLGDDPDRNVLHSPPSAVSRGSGGG